MISRPFRSSRYTSWYAESGVSHSAARERSIAAPTTATALPSAEKIGTTTTVVDGLPRSAPWNASDMKGFHCRDTPMK